MRDLNHDEWIVPGVITVIMTVVMVAGLLLALALAEESPTCPNYGEVPALIDGGYECIPWEVQR